MDPAGAPLMPVSWNLQGKSVLVVGGGPVGARKARSFLDCGALVTGLAPHFCAAWPEQAAKWERPWQDGDQTGFNIVVAATNAPLTNRTICDRARAEGIWCSDVSQPATSDFHNMAVFRRGGINVGIGTSGLSPLLARHLRDRIAEAIGPEYLQLQEMAAHCGFELQQREEFWRRALASGVLEQLREGRLAEAQATLLQMASEIADNKNE